VRIIVEVTILLVQTIVGEMRVWVMKVFRRVVLLRCQSHQPILVEPDDHRVNHRCDKHVDAEVILVAVPQSRLVQVLLDHIASLALVEILLLRFSFIGHIPDVTAHCIVRMRIHLFCIVLLLLAQKFLILLLMLQRIGFQLLLHLLVIVRNEDSTTLAPGFWLCDKKHSWCILGLRFCHLSFFQHRFALLETLGIVLKNLVRVLWVQPRLWEE